MSAPNPPTPFPHHPLTAPPKQEGDPYDFAEPLDILPGLSKEALTVGDDRVPFWECFESKKWNVRKAALDRVKELARAPRCAPGPCVRVCVRVPGPGSGL